AGGRRQEVVAVRVIEVIVDADHDVQRALLDGGSDYDLAHATPEVRLQSLRGAKPSRALEHDLHAEISPRALARLRCAAVADLGPLDRQNLTVAMDILGPPPMNRVERQQVSSRARVGSQLVDMDERELRPTPRCPQRQPAHAPEAVDADAAHR